MYILMFSISLTKGTNFHAFLVSSLADVALQKGSFVLGKNLLIEEHILSF